uniref:Putative secreted peptide n=1 Tax=Anopheles braziliensis TaxID=58242 RepID=A0A2M3ZWG6_9DIPT
MVCLARAGSLHLLLLLLQLVLLLLPVNARRLLAIDHWLAPSNDDDTVCSGTVHSYALPPPRRDHSKYHDSREIWPS